MALRYFLKSSLKGMVVRRIKKIITKLDISGPAARRSGSGRKRTVRAVDNIIDVEARNLRNFDKKTKRRKSRVLCRTLFSERKSVVLRNCDNASCKCGTNMIKASLMRQSSNGVRVSMCVLQQMADSLNINFEWNIIRTT